MRPTGCSRSWNRAGAPLQEAQDQLEMRAGILMSPNEDKAINWLNISAIKLHNDDHAKWKMNFSDLQSTFVVFLLIFVFVSEYLYHEPRLQVQIHLSVRLCWPRSFPNGTPVFSDLYSEASFNKFSAQFTKQYSGFMINLDLPCTASAQWRLGWLLLSHRLLLRHVFTPTKCLSLWNTAHDTPMFDNRGRILFFKFDPFYLSMTSSKSRICPIYIGIINKPLWLNCSTIWSFYDYSLFPLVLY